MYLTADGRKFNRPAQCQSIGLFADDSNLAAVKQSCTLNESPNKSPSLWIDNLPSLKVHFQRSGATPYQILEPVRCSSLQNLSNIH